MGWHLLARICTGSTGLASHVLFGRIVEAAAQNLHPALGCAQRIAHGTRTLLHVLRWQPPQWPPLAPQLALSCAGCARPLAHIVAVQASAEASAATSGPAALRGMVSPGPGVAATAAATTARAAAEVFGFAILFKQKKMFRGVHGTLNPSLWKWYHRNGYWATRRKNIDFGTKRRWRYNQVEGLGKHSKHYRYRYAQFWMDPSYYKPFKNYCRF
mmetsp:Transcript_128121/g.255816  ORF Transcript_128121/g.255816 Transcript_128121/m.255816 type:complete len:214 (+) Transcript_128121:52-693(+)